MELDDFLAENGLAPPNPLELLKNFTLPVAIKIELSDEWIKVGSAGQIVGRVTHYFYEESFVINANDRIKAVLKKGLITSLGIVSPDAKKALRRVAQ